MRRATWILVVALAASSAACGGDDDATSGGVASSAELRSALATARAGDVVALAAATFDGPFDLPAGVTLVGAGQEQSRIRVAAGQIGLRIRAGAGTTALRAIGIDNDGRAGVLAIGADHLVLQDVSVSTGPSAPTGPSIAIGAERTATVELTNVVVQGPVRSDGPAVVGRLPIFGVVLTDVGRATLGNVSARGFVEAAVLSVRTELVWTGGGVQDGFGQGLGVLGGSATLTELHIGGLRRSTDLTLGTYGIAAAAGAMLDTDGVTITDIDGFGAYHGDAAALHTVLAMTGGRDTSVWLQRGARVTVEDSTIGSGAFAGFAAVGATELVVRGTEVQDIERAEWTSPGAMLRSGDGVQVVELPGMPRLANLELTDVVLASCARVGLLANLAGASTGVLSFSGVVVRGPDDAYGALVQDGEVVEGWDSGITREGSLAANDLDAPTLPTAPPIADADQPSFAGGDDGIAGIIGPPD